MNEINKSIRLLACKIISTMFMVLWAYKMSCKKKNQQKLRRKRKPKQHEQNENNLPMEIIKPHYAHLLDIFSAGIEYVARNKMSIMSILDKSIQSLCSACKWNSFDLDKNEQM